MAPETNGNRNSVRSGFGNALHVEICGGSHEPFVGVTLTGLPAGFEIDKDALFRFMELRAPGRSPLATGRREPDIPVFTSGLTEGTWKTDGTPLTIKIENTDVRSGDYDQMKTVPRPGHADFSAYMKYRKNGTNTGPCMAGGGPFSARLTAPLCAAGGIAMQLLEKNGISIGAHIFSAGDVYDTPFDPAQVTGSKLKKLAQSPFPVHDEVSGEKMKALVLEMKEAGDSAGGIIEAAVTGLPAGKGGPMYDGVESILSPILFGIPAVKGVEFGTGFASAYLKGSENNDPFVIRDGKVSTVTNHHGGILGGITTGMPLIVRVAFKPTPSIALEQDSVDLEKMAPAKIKVSGRHDPCVALRAAPAVNAALALGLSDLLLQQGFDCSCQDKDPKCR